jgi:hypothetical protein
VSEEEEVRRAGRETQSGQAEDAVEQQAEAHEEAAAPTSGADREEVDEPTVNPATRHGPKPAGP